MADPISATVIIGLAAGKFAEGAAGKAAEKLVEKLWNSIASRFKGRQKVEETIAQIEASQDKGAIGKLEKVLDGEFAVDEEFRSELEAIVREIRQAEPELEARVNNIINSSGANAVNVMENSGTINYGVK